VGRILVAVLLLLMDLPSGKCTKDKAHQLLFAMWFPFEATMFVDARATLQITHFRFLIAKLFLELLSFEEVEQVLTVPLGHPLTCVDILNKTFALFRGGPLEKPFIHSSREINSRVIVSVDLSRFHHCPIIFKAAYKKEKLLGAVCDFFDRPSCWCYKYAWNAECGPFC
jgi:hypothetical protein